MGLTADDIVNYPLKQAIRGYSVAQVDDLLDEVADRVEGLESEVAELRGRLRDSEDRLASSSETETTLTRTLVTAQRAAEQSLEEARQEAAELVEGARRESATLLEQARREADELQAEAVETARAEEAEIRRRRQVLEGHVEALRLFEQEHRARLRGHLEEQLRALDELRDAPAPAMPPEARRDAASESEHSPGLTVRVREETDGPEHADGGDGAEEPGPVGSSAAPEEGDEDSRERTEPMA